MFQHHLEPITAEERELVERIRERPIIKKLLRRTSAQKEELPAFVDVYDISTGKCFIPRDFNEELPLYLLDLDGMILILFGQWMFDPHSLVAPKEVFETWDCEGAFFGSFSLRCLAQRGTVLQLAVEGGSFVEALRLGSVLRFNQLRECQFVPVHGAGLIGDLEKAGIIEAKQAIRKP